MNKYRKHTHSARRWMTENQDGIRIFCVDTGYEVCRASDMPSVINKHDYWSEDGGTEEQKANAQHIVKCVNSHDELVALLEESLIFLTDHNDLYRIIESALQSMGEEV